MAREDNSTIYIGKDYRGLLSPVPSRNQSKHPPNARDCQINALIAQIGGLKDVI
jgi:hypothetical protein